MNLGDVSLGCAWALVDQLAREGMRHSCLSPGSRSTPLALALERHPGIQVHVHLDERSSAFFALGIAKATSDLVAVACTSGTAAAELFPAVVEASQSRVPLVLLTADRPPRLRGTGANQTIDQVELFGRYARSYIEPAVPAGPGDEEAWALAGADAARSARLGPVPGPVHVNCPFEEPLTPSPDVRLPDPGPVEPTRLPASPSTYENLKLIERLAATERGLFVVGGLARPEPAILDLAEAMGIPVIAEPHSGLRLPGRSLSAGTALAVAMGEGLIGPPEILVRFGAYPTSRALQALDAEATYLVVVGDEHLDPDPEGRAHERILLPDRSVASGLGRAAPETGRVRWTEGADAASRRAIDELISSWDEPFEGRIARDLAAVVPEGASLIAGSSMPIRDLDGYMAPRSGLCVLANRGASGIDGFVSTALGVAATGAPTYALSGDLTFLYDIGALVWNARRGLHATFVVIDNGGGAIFDFLPQKALAEHDRLFTTPHDQDIGALCAAAGAGHARVERAADLTTAIEAVAGSSGIQVVEVASDRRLNVERHEQVRTAVARALSSA